ncbi:hypothetical protein QBC45DRAFT_206552 [Copromyces sp. CBS 386.78]|nr:hypothetical protein QBC45DRAFT_206552 [Copromyces sp. CBS 386.78]
MTFVISLPQPLTDHRLVGDALQPANRQIWSGHIESFFIHFYLSPCFVCPSGRCLATIKGGYGSPRSSSSKIRRQQTQSDQDSEVAGLLQNSPTQRLFVKQDRQKDTHNPHLIPPTQTSHHLTDPPPKTSTTRKESCRANTTSRVASTPSTDSTNTIIIPAVPVRMAKGARERSMKPISVIRISNAVTPRDTTSASSALPWERTATSRSRFPAPNTD